MELIKPKIKDYPGKHIELAIDDPGLDFAAAEANQAAKTLCRVRAGHEPAMLFGPSGSKLQDLSGEGMALGVVADYNYKEYSLQGWEAGSLVVVGTDGIRETRNVGG